jgi:2-oxoglutarate ferredoxin oxidoreductase subunit alpha
MMQIRAEKIARIASDIPPAQVTGPSAGDILVVGWGSTQGAIMAAVGELESAGHAVAHLHLRHLNPLPMNLGTILGSYRRVVVAENNLGQLATLLRAQYPVAIEQLNKTEGRPFLIREIRDFLKGLLNRE